MNSTDNLVNYASNGGGGVIISNGGSLRNGSFASVKSVPKLADFITPNVENGTHLVLGSDEKAKSLAGGSAGSSVGDPDEEEEFDPLSEEVPDNERTNYGQTLMNLMNGIIGSGILSMPIAFLNGGWLVACIVTPLIGAISCYCIHLLLSVNVYLTAATGKASPYDYHEMAEYAFLLGPKRLRRFSKFARLAVIWTIVCTQVGACCVYYVFIATNFRKFLEHRIGDPSRLPSESICLVAILPVVVAINWIRNIRYLSYLSTVANILQVAGISVVLYDLFSMPIGNLDRLPAVGSKIPQFFVTTLFIFEGSSVSMSLYKAIKKQRQFRMPLGVLNVGELAIMVAYTGVGFFGYLQYGELTEGTITASLPAEPMYDAVQLSYAVVVLGTYPILLYVPIQVLWGILKRKLAPRLRSSSSGDLAKHPVPAGGKRLLVAELAFRTALVVVTYLLAVLVPKLDLIIAVVGAVTSSSIAVIIPSILHTVTFWDQRRGRLAKLRLLSVNLVLFLIGITAFILGFYFSLADIIDSYRHHGDHVTKPPPPFPSSLPPQLNGTTLYSPSTHHHF
ncbi:hypothetical protein TYRP_016119 [Tyrophagus putrescentiae]|nr:hypothetical protein TYRP_016119 [Tyrophagus putrescentiae]